MLTVLKISSHINVKLVQMVRSFVILTIKGGSSYWENIKEI